MVKEREMTMTENPKRKLPTRCSATSWNVSEAQRAEEFARGVAGEMVRLRGWRRLDAAPSEVRDDVFATMAHHDGVYVAGYAAGIAPSAVAQTIQDREWDRARFR